MKPDVIQVEISQQIAEVFERIQPNERRRHALAAMALHDLMVDGKLAGFTREDVVDCRDAGDAATCGKAYPDDLYGRMNNLADRIEALLPP